MTRLSTNVCEKYLKHSNLNRSDFDLEYFKAHLEMNWQ